MTDEKKPAPPTTVKKMETFLTCPTHKRKFPPGGMCPQCKEEKERR